MFKKLSKIPKLCFVQVGLSLVLIGLALSFDYEVVNLYSICGFIALTCGIFALIGDVVEIYIKYLA